MKDKKKGTLKRIQKVMSEEMDEGEGARVKRLFPTEEQGPFDPFVLLDEFFLDRNAHFPPHTHRGFESITYLLAGSVRHKDNLGNDSVIVKGGTQRLTTGAGVIHSEMPENDELSHGLQLWVNLPKSSKSMKPSYSQVKAEELPEKKWKGGQAKTICGPESPLQIETQILYQDIQLESGSTFSCDPTGYDSGLIYVIEGKLAVGDTVVSAGEGVFWKEGRKIAAKAMEACRFAFLAGLPHQEEIQINGTCVD